jgi:hypothetical protein
MAAANGTVFGDAPTLPSGGPVLAPLAPSSSGGGVGVAPGKCWAVHI